MYARLAHHTACLDARPPKRVERAEGRSVAVAADLLLHFFPGWPMEHGLEGPSLLSIGHTLAGVAFMTTYWTS